MSDTLEIDGYKVIRDGASVIPSEGSFKHLPEFAVLCGHPDHVDNGTRLITKEPIEADWDVYLVIEVTDWLDATGDEDRPGWLVSIKAVAPEAASAEGIDSSFRCIGIDDWEEYAEDEGWDDETKRLATIDALVSYGIYAPLSDFWSDEPEPAVKAAKLEAQGIRSLFGFYMDRVCNRIGNTGWDFISGNIGF